MRRDKAVARILLIFSITNVVLAAPAAVRQRGSDGESTDGSSPPSAVSDSGYLPDNDVSASHLLSSPDHHHPPYLSDDSDASSTMPLSTEFDTDRYYSDQLSSSHFNSIHESEVSSGSFPGLAPESVYYDRPPGSETSEPHEDLPTLGNPPSQDNPPPASDAPRLPDSPPSGPEAAQLHEGSHPWWNEHSLPWWHNHWDPLAATEQVVSDHGELKLRGL